MEEDPPLMMNPPLILGVNIFVMIAPQKEHLISGVSFIP